MSKRLSVSGVVIGLVLAVSAGLSAQAVTRIVASYSGATIALLADSSGRLRVVNEGTISLPASCADTRVVFADGAQTPGCDAGLAYVKATDTLWIGNSSREADVGNALVVSRTFNTTSGHGHSINDFSTITGGGGNSYASYNARTLISGSGSFGHYVAFQAAPETTGTVSLTQVYGVFVQPVIGAGTTVTTLYDYYVAAPTVAGTLTTHYAWYSESGQHFFGGPIRVLASTAASNAIQKDGVAGTGIFFSADDQVSFGISGTQRHTFDASSHFILQQDARILLGESADVILARGGANILDLRNATNAQRFNLGNTFTSTSVREDWSQYFASSVFHMGTTHTGATARVATWDFGGTTTSAISVPITSGNITFGGNLLVSGAFNVGDGGGNSPAEIHAESYVQSPTYYLGPSNGQLTSISDGVIRLSNYTASGFSRLILGTNDTTTAGVSIGKDSGGHLIVRRGDGSTGTLTVANVGANSCGTTAATIAGTDHVFAITVGATAGTQCRVTFVAAWAAAPACWVNNNTTANLAQARSATTTTVDILGTFVAGDEVAVKCDR